ncbi:MAG: protease [Erythrobacteraceae bacterium]|nr:protease [Citromicrobium sp.]MAS84797.1 protease [Erythrobacteraceae bacterium]MBT47045.1 protease [Citromicrobium sp.]
MRYAYGVTSALLLGGATISLITGQPAGAQVAQNDDARITAVTPRAGAPASFADLTEQLAPAVVNISTRQRVEVQSSNPFAGTPFEGMFGDRGGDQPTTREGQSLGSGFLISADGYVVTNNHVVTPQGNGTVEEITVTMPDGSEYEAKMVGKDAESDLAVLKIDRAEPFPFVKFGDSAQARAGDWVVAIGNPFGLGGTVTSGIISSVLRTAGAGAYDRFIQTDAAINRGNSGGPLFDMQGNVIGINNAILSPSGGSVGVGFAIPADTAAPIVERLRRGEAIERGYLGVSIGPVTDDFAAALGLPRNRGEVVQSVVDGEAAQKAGIEPGDVVISVNGKDVTPDQTLSFLVANVKPGTTIPVTLIRDGKQRTIKLKVGTRPSAEELAQSQMFGDEGEEDEMNAPLDQEEFLAEKLGLGVVPINPGIARQLGISAETTGLAVAAVDRNSDAARKGIQRRDIILSANYRPVTSAEQLEGIVRDAERDGRNAVVLRVQRARGPAGYVAVRIQD